MGGGFGVGVDCGEVDDSADVDVDDDDDGGDQGK